MFDWQQKRAFRVVFASPLLQVLLLATFIMVATSAIERYRIAQVMADRRISTEKQQATLETRRMMLQERVDYLSNERGIEAELRRQFDVARQGEQVVVIVDQQREEPLMQPVSASPVASNTPDRWYQFWR